MHPKQRDQHMQRSRGGELTNAETPNSLLSQELQVLPWNLEMRCGYRLGEISEAGFYAGEGHNQFTWAVGGGGGELQGERQVSSPL